MIKKIIFSAAGALLASAAVAFANPYQGIRYAETEGKIYEHKSGQLAIANSTATWSTYTIVMDGEGGLITASSVSLRGSISVGSYLGLPITSTAAISTSLSSLAGADVALSAVDVIHTSSITALQVSTGALKSEIDAIILSTGSIVAGTVTLNSTQTFTGQNTFTNMVTVSSDVYVGGVLDMGLEISSATCNSGAFCQANCSSGKKVISCGYSVSVDRFAWAVYAEDADTCRVNINSDVSSSLTTFAFCARVK